MQPNQLVAVDSNILLSLADEKDDVIDVWQLIQERLRLVMLVVSPTVLGDSARKHRNSRRASAALQSKHSVSCVAGGISNQWNFAPHNKKLPTAWPWLFENEGCFRPPNVTTASFWPSQLCLECMLLVSEDSHLDGIDRAALKSLLAKFYLSSPVVATPRALLKKIYNR